jgi:FlaA1/EpsC-like NDP-sugar epimerase
VDNSDIPVKILFLAADPSDEARLRLGQELRDIRERLQLSKERDRFILESRESVRVVDITQAIFDVDPQIVHFSGHGTSTGELYFESLTGKSQLVQADALAALFERFATEIDCVVLNACYSEIQAKAIAQHIRFVIGMNQAIGDFAVS